MNIENALHLYKRFNSKEGLGEKMTSDLTNRLPSKVDYQSIYWDGKAAIDEKRALWKNMVRWQVKGD